MIPDRPSFEIINRPGHVRVRFDGADVLELINEHAWFRNLRNINLRTRPHGPVECINLGTSCFYENHYLRAKIAASKSGEHEVQIILTPDKVDHDLDKIVHETRTLTLRYLPDSNRFRYDVQVRLHFLQDVMPKMPFLSITSMPQWGNDDYAVVEFDDPMLAGGVGPQVPMTQDWQGVMEPWFEEHCFTTQWRKRYTHAILNTAERGWKKILLSKTGNSAQQFYNRHLLRCVSQSTFYYLKTDGNYLAISHDYPQGCGHHICEWGMDMHCYALFAKSGPDRLFSAGQEINLAYHIEELQADEIPKCVVAASLAEFEPEELKLADAPIYEEPCCHFKASALDHPDAQAWRLEGSGSWQRDGGRRQDEGALLIEHGKQTKQSQWIFKFYGPSRACNPIPPMTKHKISAWVKATQSEKFALELRLTHFNGPAMVSSREVKVFQVTLANILRSEGDWHYLECVTEPCGSYVLCGEIVFVYRGLGHALLSELAVARI